jgi:hypothetical protein
MEKPMSRPQPPQTDSIRELAHFWDTHDLTEFENQLQEVAEPAFARENALSVPLLSDEAEAVHEIAISKGLTDVELIQQWVREKIEAV